MINFPGDRGFDAVHHFDTEDIEKSILHAAKDTYPITENRL